MNHRLRMLASSIVQGVVSAEGPLMARLPNAGSNRWQDWPGHYFGSTWRSGQLDAQIGVKAYQFLSICRLPDRHRACFSTSEQSGIPEKQMVIDEKVSCAAREDHPLVRSLRSILKEIDEQYERERQSLIATLPDASVKDRALAMLESRHHQRRETYSRELIALLSDMS